MLLFFSKFGDNRLQPTGEIAAGLIDRLFCGVEYQFCDGSAEFLPQFRLVFDLLAEHHGHLLGTLELGDERKALLDEYIREHEGK